MRNLPRKEGAARCLRDFLCGVLIGAGAILPGVSGGVLAVVFGIYRPFMELLTAPRTAIPQYWRDVLPIALGWCVGFLGFARGITAAFRLSATVTTWLFIGLIAGTLPALFQKAGERGRSRAAWVSFAVCGAGMLGGLRYLACGAEIAVEPNIWWYNFCGVLWGAGVVIPGFTSATLMMAMGLYQPMMEHLARLDLPVLLAALPGMLLTILLLARWVRGLFRRHYAAAFHGILGMVLASTLAIVPLQYESGEGILSLVCCAGGCLLAFLLERLEKTETG